MRVIYSIGAHFATTGISSVAYRAVSSINKAGYLHRLICLDYKDTEIPDEKIKSFRILKYVLWFPIKGIQRYILHRFKSYEYLDRLYDYLASKRIEKCDIFHGWRNHSRLTALKAKKLGAIVVIENASSHPYVAKKLIEEEYKKYGVKLEIYSERTLRESVKELNNSDYIFVPSEFAYESFLQQGFPKEKLIKIPFGIDLARFSPQKDARKDSKFRVIFAGQVNLRKGVQYLLEAWQELKLKNAELIIVGRIMPEIMEIIKLYSENESIKFIGFTDLKKHYANSDIFVFPSIEEGSALVNYEAMACGLPVITTPNAGSLVRNGKDGFLIPIRDKDSIKRKIKYFYNNPHEIRRMGKNARQNIKNYTWEAYGNRIVSAYKKIMANSKG